MTPGPQAPRASDIAKLCTLITGEPERTALTRYQAMSDEQLAAIRLNISAEIPPLALFTGEALVAAGWTPPPPPG